MGAALTNWILAGWALAATVTVVVVGKISDIFGRRWVMIAGSGWALIGSVRLRFCVLSDRRTQLTKYP